MIIMRTHFSPLRRPWEPSGLCSIVSEVEGLGLAKATATSREMGRHDSQYMTYPIVLNSWEREMVIPWESLCQSLCSDSGPVRSEPSSCKLCVPSISILLFLFYNIFPNTYLHWVSFAYNPKIGNQY